MYFLAQNRAVGTVWSRSEPRDAIAIVAPSRSREAVQPVRDVTVDHRGCDMRWPPPGAADQKIANIQGLRPDCLHITDLIRRSAEREFLDTAYMQLLGCAL